MASNFNDSLTTSNAIIRSIATRTRSCELLSWRRNNTSSTRVRHDQ